MEHMLRRNAEGTLCLCVPVLWAERTLCCGLWLVCESAWVGLVCLGGLGWAWVGLKGHRPSGYGCARSIRTHIHMDMEI